MVRRNVVQVMDERSGAAPLVRKGLRYLFPDHWSFLLGELAVYAFIFLIATGIYLTLFFEPSLSKTTYEGAYLPLQGLRVSDAYRSVIDLSFDQPAGLLIRQAHHWAADVFLAAIVVHLLRVFFTGAFRKPRELTWILGVLMLFTALLEGYLGYSIVDDLLSGMGLAIGYGVALSLPLIGGNVALGVWGSPFPGADSFESRMFIAHVLLLPALIAILMGGHLALVALRHHTQFRGRRGQSERRLVGVPSFPGQAPRSLGLMLGTFGLLFALGGLFQINPVWQWGPYETGLSTNGAQPDWYLGWLIGALRLIPGFDVTVGDYTLVPNPFWGGALFPLAVLVALLAVPFAERRLTGSDRFHNLLDRPRDAPRRTAFGAALLSWVVVVLIAGSLDRAYVYFGLPYQTLIWVFRVLAVAGPFVVYALTKRACLGLQGFDRVEEVREEAEEEAVRAAAAADRGAPLPSGS